ncbi:MAG: TlpA family protein disulfide reductase, partial [Pseudomonadota bacterium]
MNRTAVLVVLVAAIGAGTGWLIGNQLMRPARPAGPAVAVETMVPDLTLPQAGGGERNLAAFRGRPVLI